MNMEAIFWTIRLMGACLIIGGSVGIGLRYSGQLHARITCLKELKQLIILLKGEIRYAITPLPEALERLVTKTKSPFKEWLSEIVDDLNEMNNSQFYEIWQQSIEHHLKESSLEAKELKQLMDFGKNLGFLDKEMQMNAIDLYLENLEYEIEQLQESIPKKTRLYNSLGVLFGIFLVILLI